MFHVEGGLWNAIPDTKANLCGQGRHEPVLHDEL